MNRDGRDLAANREAESGLTRRAFLAGAVVVAGGIGAVSLGLGRPDTVAAAGADLAPATAARRVRPQLRQGGTFTVASNADIATVDPHTSGLIVWGIVKQNVFDQLAYFDGADFQVKAKLAREWWWEDGDTGLMVKIQDGVRFHNGDPLTAEDVKATFDRVRAPATGSPWSTLVDEVKEVEVVDRTTVRFKTDGVSNKLVGALPWIDIVSKRQIESDQLGKMPVGSGPFRWGEWRVNDQIRIERNPDYWRTGADGRPLPYLDAIVYKPITQIETRIAALESGQVDFVFDLTLKDVDRIKRNPNLAVALADPVDWLFTAYLNMRKPPFDNQKVRQAFAYAIDREGFIKAFLGGNAKAHYGIFAEGHPAYNPALKGKFAYDPDMAAKLLSEAGYPGGRGLSFTLLIPSGYPEYRQLSEMMQGTWSDLGAQVAIEEVELATWANRLIKTREFDAAVDGTRRCASDPAITFSGGYIFPPGPNNICGFMPEMLPDYVDAVKQAGALKDQSRRMELYRRAAELFVDFAPGPIIAHKSIAHAHSTRVQNLVAHPQYHQDFATIWLS